MFPLLILAFKALLYFSEIFYMSPDLCLLSCHLQEIAVV